MVQITEQLPTLPSCMHGVLVTQDCQHCGDLSTKDRIIDAMVAAGNGVTNVTSEPTDTDVDSSKRKQYREMRKQEKEQLQIELMRHRQKWKQLLEQRDKLDEAIAVARKDYRSILTRYNSFRLYDGYSEWIEQHYDGERK